MLPPISSVDFSQFKGIDPSIKEICTLELTVTTGLEEVAALELKEKLQVNPIPCRGRIIFDIHISKINEVLKMRSVDHVNIILFVDASFEFTKDRENCLEKIFKSCSSPDWDKGIKVWKSINDKDIGDPFEMKGELKGDYCSPKPQIDLRYIKKDSGISVNLPDELVKTITETKDNIDIPNEKIDKEIVQQTQRQKSCGPKFRVTCHRVGENHNFGSPEAARQFGGGINELFGWPVDLSNFDVEILLSITDEFVYVGISLTKEPLFRRNITHFGPTNLRATICYNMIQLAKPELGDFVVDPMCGGSTISMEGAITHNSSFHLGGDNNSMATNRSRQNINHLISKKSASLCSDVIQWDVTKLPLRDQVCDVIVSDLPFGKRLGSKVDNRVLYFKSLVELARVTKINTGRAVLLTQDRNSMTKNLLRVKSLWKNFSTRFINIGGLIAGIFLLRRTDLLKDDTLLNQTDSASVRRRNLKRKWISDPTTQKE